MPTINKPTKKNNKNNNNNKSIAQRYVYNTPRWTKLRLKKLMNNPLCEICESFGRTELATQVHHITPFMNGTTIQQIQFLGFDYNNLQSLCEGCHIRAHRNDKGDG